MNMNTFVGNNTHNENFLNDYEDLKFTLDYVAEEIVDSKDNLHLNDDVNSLINTKSSNLSGKNIDDVIDYINKTAVNSGIYMCPMCENKFGTSLGLHRHIVRSHSKEILLYKCKNCDKSFRTRTHCNQHKCDNNKKKLIKLTELSSPSFNKEEKLSNIILTQIYGNIQMDSDTFMFICPLCQISVKHKISLKHHLFQNHSIDGRLTKCHICGTEVKNKLNLLSHMRSTKCKKKRDGQCFFKERKLKYSSNENFEKNNANSDDCNDQNVYSCAKSSSIFSSKAEIEDECDLNNLNDTIYTTKQKYLRTLKILKKAELNRQKLKSKLLALGENLQSSDSDSENNNEIELLLTNLKEDKNQDYRNKITYFDIEYVDLENNLEDEYNKYDQNQKDYFDISKEFNTSKGISVAETNDELLEIHSLENLEEEIFFKCEADIKSEKCNENLDEIPQADNISEDAQSNVVEIYFDSENKKNYINDKEEPLEEEFLIETDSNEKCYIKTDDSDNNFLHINFVHDRTSKIQSNMNNEESYAIDYVDDTITEDRIDSQFIESSYQKQDLELKTELEILNSTEKYNEKFMSFLFKSLMKEELQRDKVRKDCKKKQKEIQDENFKSLSNKSVNDQLTEKITNDPTANFENSKKKIENNNKTKMQTTDQATDTKSKYQCPFCDKVFLKKFKLDMHVRVHTGEKPYKCSYCERRCCDRASLEIHERRHTNDRRHKCEFCDEKFFTIFEKKRHQITWHQNESKRKLEKVGSLRHNMTYDQKRIYGPKALLGEDGLYHCKMCNKVCLTAKTMRKHTALHLNGKACPICSKVFAYDSTLQRHLRAPHEEKNFMCTFCGNRYASAGSLKSHIKVHSENAIKCPLCPKVFGTIYNLDRHMIHKHKLKKWQGIYKDIIVEKLEEE